MRREFLMLAHKYNPEKHFIGGFFVSEKLDGMRVWWDGGITRGLPKTSVPWANNAKDERYVSAQICTGLWSRYGNIIHAPDWWLDQMPRMPLDGELYSDRYRQDLMSIVKTLISGEGWRDVNFWAFDCPSYQEVFQTGLIKGTNFTKSITLKDCHNLVNNFDVYQPLYGRQFLSTVKLLEIKAVTSVCRPLNQRALPYEQDAARDKAWEFVEAITDQGGEGIMLRAPYSTWEPRRSHSLLKVKKLHDDEGIVVGYTSGRKTEKGSKLLGMMGALILDYRGKRLELSGFTDAERKLTSRLAPYFDHDAVDWARQHPGQECDNWIHNPLFPLGSKVTFRYRTLTKDGIPEEARYWRRRDDGTC